MELKNERRIEKQIIHIVLANDVVLDKDTLNEIRDKAMRPIAHLVGDWKIQTLVAKNDAT